MPGNDDPLKEIQKLRKELRDGLRALNLRITHFQQEADAEVHRLDGNDATLANVMYEIARGFEQHEDMLPDIVAKALAPLIAVQKKKPKKKK